MHKLSLSVSPLNIISFKANPQKVSGQKRSNGNENPISRKGETMNLIKATFIAGLGIGLRLLFEIFDGDFVFETAGKQGKKMVDKSRNSASAAKKQLLTVGAAGALIAAGISGFALLYTLYKAPKIAYDSKVNTFKKSKEMDVYIKSNEAEQNIYSQMSEQAKIADDEQRDKLKGQFMQMQKAKNKVPDFIQFKS